MATEYKLPYTANEINAKLGKIDNLALKSSVPTKTSDITNDSGFITNVVSDLVNYYTKDQVKDVITAMLDEIPKFSIAVVGSLPTTNISETTVYLVTSGAGSDLYTEYIYVNGTWEILGSQRVDLTGYATEVWVDEKLADYIASTELQNVINTALAEAKASGEFDGANGLTPRIHTDGNWWVGDNNTGTKAAGQDGVSATHSWNGTTLTVTSASGTSSADLKGEKGASVTVTKVSESTADGGSNVVTFSDGKTLTVKNGSKGSNGKDGTSVTVSKVTESTADGGSNIITFSDGNSVTIKNGSIGATGATGASGKSAYQYAKDGGYTGTEEEFAAKMAEENPTMEEFNQLSETIGDLPNNELLVQNVAQKVPYVKVAEHPTFVDSISEMTDTSKMYVLKSDGMFYSYKEHTTTTPGGTVANFTNKMPTSIDADGNVYNGTGYKGNTRLNSSGMEKESSYQTTFGYIPAKGGDTIRFKGKAKNDSDAIWYDTNQSNNYICVYDADFNFLYAGTPKGAYGTNTFVESMNLEDSTSVIKLKDVENIAYFRMNVWHHYSESGIDGETVIITVNEEITYTTTEEGTTTTYSWESTGISYNQPADYEHRIIAMENELEVLLNGSF